MRSVSRLFYRPPSSVRVLWIRSPLRYTHPEGKKKKNRMKDCDCEFAHQPLSVRAVINCNNVPVHNRQSPASAQVKSHLKILCFVVVGMFYCPLYVSKNSIKNDWICSISVSRTNIRLIQQI